MIIRNEKQSENPATSVTPVMEIIHFFSNTIPYQHYSKRLSLEFPIFFYFAQVISKSLQGDKFFSPKV
jgi:hypothetical protein